MDNPWLEAVLAGSDENSDLFNLYVSLTDPMNEAQRAVHRALEAIILLSSDGFEKLFEQEPSLEEYAEALVEVGLPQMKPIFEQVLALVPHELRKPENEAALFKHLRSLFDELDRLLSASYDASADSDAVIARYVRRHRDQFVPEIE
jgi:hypothetical protein